MNGIVDVAIGSSRGLSSDLSPAVQLIRVRRSELIEAVWTGFSELVNQRRWHFAIRLLVIEGGVSEAELARHLEVTRSTVNRWMGEKTVPSPYAMPLMAERIRKLLESLSLQSSNHIPS